MESDLFFYSFLVLLNMLSFRFSKLKHDLVSLHISESRFESCLLLPFKLTVAQD